MMPNLLKQIYGISQKRRHHSQMVSNRQLFSFCGFFVMGFRRSVSSSALVDARSVAIFLNRTGAAQGRNGPACLPAERNHEGIVNNPIRPRQLVAQGKFRLVGGLGGDISQTIGNAVNVRIHTNPFFAVGERDDQIGGFSADTFDAQQVVKIIRHPGVKPADQLSAYEMNTPCFIPVKAHGINGPGDFLFRDVKHVLGGRSQCEKTVCGFGRHFIFGAQAKECRNQNHKWIPLAFGKMCHDGHLSQIQFFFKNFYNGMNVSVLHVSQPRT